MNIPVLSKNTLISILIAALLAACLTTGASVAWGDDTTSESNSTAILSQESTSISVEDSLADSDELLYGYLDSQLFGNSDISLLSTSTSYETTLTEDEQGIYAQLKSQIEKVAAGEESSTRFTVNSQDYGTAYSLADLGLTENATREELSEALITHFTNEVSLTKVMTCLMADCPYELYWFDKGTGYRYGWIGNSVTEDDGTTYYYVASITFSLDVSEDYSADGTRETQTVNTTKTQAVATAINNAKEIANNVATKGLSDWEALTYFKETICERTSYNFDAMSDYDSGKRGYGDPWQLIYVFDDDTSNKVVCEGYSKAFQYLCELADLKSVDCYSVLGTLDLDGEAESHMWNLVCYEGKSYLVDITNSDEDTIGQNGELFMVNGYSDNFVKGDQYSYTFNASLDDGEYASTATYTYGTSTLTLYSNDLAFLALAGSDPEDESNDDDEEPSDPEDESNDDEESSDPESETNPLSPEETGLNPSSSTVTTTATTTQTSSTSATPKTSDNMSLFAIAACLVCLGAAGVGYSTHRRNRS